MSNNNQNDVTKIIKNANIIENESMLLIFPSDNPKLIELSKKIQKIINKNKSNAQRVNSLFEKRLVSLYEEIVEKEYEYELVILKVYKGGNICDNIFYYKGELVLNKYDNDYENILFLPKFIDKNKIQIDEIIIQSLQNDDIELINNIGAYPPNLKHFKYDYSKKNY